MDPLGLTHQLRRLMPAEERFVGLLAAPVIADDEERVLVIGELPDQGLPGPIEGFDPRGIGITRIGLNASRAER
jgi:hypothetical protein